MTPRCRSASTALRSRAAAHLGEAGHAADRLFTLGRTAAQEEVGDALFRDDVGDVVAVDHDGREIEVQLLRHRDAVERLDEVRRHLLAEGLEDLHHQLAPAGQISLVRPRPRGRP